MRPLHQFFKIVMLLGLVASLASCGSSDDDDELEFIHDPCGTVIDLAPVDDFVTAKFEADDCRFSDIDPDSTYDGFVDEYRITTSGGAVEIDMYTQCFNSGLYLLNTPTSCSSGCSNFDSLVLARGLRVDYPGRPHDGARINIDVIAGTYLILAVGPDSIGDCNRYPIRTLPLYP